MFLIILGFVPLTIGTIILFVDIFNRIRCSAKVEGTVVGREIRMEYGLRFGAKTLYYYPIYEYEANGREYQNTTKQCSRDEMWYKIGDVCTLSYWPANPNVVIAKGYYGSIVYGSMFAAAGILLLLWGYHYM